MRRLLLSYENAFHEQLPIFSKILNSDLEKGKKLFAMSNPIIAHNFEEDPVINYVNASALQLWGRRWDEMINMPSRLTAPREEQKKRKHALGQLTETNAIKGYQGIRINKKGERFAIKNARIWTLWNEAGQACGQAATFDCWWML